MLGQPVLEERVGNANGDGASAISNERGRPEPGREAVAVNFCFDAGEDLVPDARIHVNSPEKPRTRDFRLLKRAAVSNPTSAGGAARPKNRPRTTFASGKDAVNSRCP